MRNVIVYLCACALLLLAAGPASGSPVKMPGDWRRGSITMESGDRYRKFGIYMFVPRDEDYLRDAPSNTNGFGGPAADHGAPAGGSKDPYGWPGHLSTKNGKSSNGKHIGRVQVTVKKPPPVPAATITIVRN